MAAALKAWSSAAGSAKGEAILRRELDSAACASTAALGSLRAEMRWLRKQRYAQALKAVGAKLRSRIALAFLSWESEIRGRQARRALERALEDADMHHVRAIAVHRAQCRAARGAAHKAGLASVTMRVISSLKTALSLWKSAVAMNRLSLCRKEKDSKATVSWANAMWRERCHTYLLVLVAAWRQAVLQLRHAAALHNQMTEHGVWLRAAETRHEAALADIRSQSRALGQAVTEQSQLQIERLFEAFHAPHSLQWLILVFESWHWTTIRWEPSQAAGKPNASGAMLG